MPVNHGSIGGANPTSSSADRRLQRKMQCWLLAQKPGHVAHLTCCRTARGRIFSLAWRMTRNRRGREDVGSRASKKRSSFEKLRANPYSPPGNADRNQRVLMLLPRSADRVSFRSTIHRG